MRKEEEIQEKGGKEVQEERGGGEVQGGGERE